MEKETFELISMLKECGASKETTISLLNEILDNPTKYIDNEDAIDELCQEKLDIDAYIALKNFKNIKN